jgi:hypothetical protein
MPPDPRPHLPPELRELGPFMPLGASNPAKTHFLYTTGRGAVAHLYVNPGPRLERSLAEREQIRGRVGRGLPALLKTVRGHDCLWVVEERVSGAPPAASQASTWFPQVAEWAVRMADPDRMPLERSASWRRHADELRATVPSSIAVGLDRALVVVGRLTATAMHGDLQRRNVLFDGNTIAAIDWEGAWLDGIPGLDLVFLAFFARSDAPDLSLIDVLAEGGDAPWGGLCAALARLGVDDASMAAALLVMLATWSLSEDRRRARLGVEPPVALFRRFLEQRGPALAERVG